MHTEMVVVSEHLVGQFHGCMSEELRKFRSLLAEIMHALARTISGGFAHCAVIPSNSSRVAGKTTYNILYMATLKYYYFDYYR